MHGKEARTEKKSLIEVLTTIRETTQGVHLTLPYTKWPDLSTRLALTAVGGDLSPTNSSHDRYHCSRSNCPAMVSATAENTRIQILPGTRGSVRV